MSMMTQIDELDNDRHMNMTFAEFVEAFVRVAEFTTLPNPVEDTQYTAQDILENNVLE